MRHYIKNCAHTNKLVFRPGKSACLHLKGGLVFIDKKTFFIIICAMFVGNFIYHYYVFGARVDNYERTINDLRGQLQQARDYNNSATEHAENAELGLRRSEDAINRSSTGITNSIERIENIQAGNSELERGLIELQQLNRSSQFIANEIRERNKITN